MNKNRAFIIVFMKDFDYLGLDARSLRVFVTVLETGSVSQAAAKLGVTQSAVSHTLDKLRRQLGDPLFVRAGRSIAPTPRALELDAPVRKVLDGLRALTVHSTFEPAAAALRYTIAANDFQRDLLLPALYRRVHSQVKSIAMDVIPSGMPQPDLLNRGGCDLLVTPHPPQGSDIFQQRLLSDRQVCFYDPNRRRPPLSPDDYFEAAHITLLFGAGEQTGLDQRLDARGAQRHIAVTVSNFSGIPAFLRGTNLVATGPSLLSIGFLSDFAWAQAPIDTGEFSMYMVWHRRDHLDPAHVWFRNELRAVAGDVANEQPSVEDRRRGS